MGTNSEGFVSGILTSITVILSVITRITADQISAFFMVAVGVTGLIYNCMKMVDWVEKRIKKRHLLKAKPDNDEKLS